MKYSVDREKDSASCDILDTYANLLFKVGQTDEAIIWEKKAVEAAIKKPVSAGELQAFRATLDKMCRREPTWVQK
jgi:hypothetical protein